MWQILGIGLLVDTLHASKPETVCEAYAALQELQIKNLGQRQTLEDKLRQKLKEQRKKFFRSHRYDFFQGQAKAVVGPEFAEQKEKREDYEVLRRLQFREQHRTELDSFLGDRSRLVRHFLAENEANLVQPKIQSELQTSLISIKKACFELLQEQEQERWLQDVPLDETAQQTASLELASLRELGKTHLKLEEQSLDLAKVLEAQGLESRQRQQQFAASRLQRTKEDFAKPEFLRPEMAGPPGPQWDAVLPFYLVNLLGQLGVT